MHDMLSSDILQVLIAVEGRYIQWEWDPQTLQNDYITLREADGDFIAIGSIARFGFRNGDVVLAPFAAWRSVWANKSRPARHPAKNANHNVLLIGVLFGRTSWRGPFHDRGF